VVLRDASSRAAAPAHENSRTCAQAHVTHHLRARRDERGTEREPNMTTNGNTVGAVTGTVAGETAAPARKTARIEYTVETRRGGPVRRAREVTAAPDRLGEVVEREIDKLVDRGGFNFDVRYEA
jgi:hypothetical protein